MDLGFIKKKLAQKGSYKTLHDAAEDIRLVWSNCMAYNADGSDFYILAQNLSKKFEDRFTKLLADHALQVPLSSSGSNNNNNQVEVSLEDKRSFAKSLYKLTKDELGKILVTLDEKCPAALVKNGTEDEVELNVDKISQDVFTELVVFANACQANNSNKTKSGGGGGNKSKNNKPATKKAKTS
jgi:hypothetical protein